ncbi:hypothetical protein HK100_008142, partial [Physocladia obscura]
MAEWADGFDGVDGEREESEEGERARWARESAAGLRALPPERRRLLEARLDRLRARVDAIAPRLRLFEPRHYPEYATYLNLSHLANTATAPPASTPAAANPPETEHKHQENHQIIPPPSRNLTLQQHPRERQSPLVDNLHHRERLQRSQSLSPKRTQQSSSNNQPSVSIAKNESESDAMATKSVTASKKHPILNSDSSSEEDDREIQSVPIKKKARTLVSTARSSAVTTPKVTAPSAVTTGPRSLTALTAANTTASASDSSSSSSSSSSSTGSSSPALSSVSSSPIVHFAVDSLGQSHLQQRQIIPSLRLEDDDILETVDYEPGSPMQTPPANAVTEARESFDAATPVHSHKHEKNEITDATVINKRTPNQHCSHEQSESSLDFESSNYNNNNTNDTPSETNESNEGKTVKRDEATWSSETENQELLKKQQQQSLPPSPKQSSEETSRKTQQSAQNDHLQVRSYRKSAAPLSPKLAATTVAYISDSSLKPKTKASPPSSTAPPLRGNIINRDRNNDRDRNDRDRNNNSNSDSNNNSNGTPQNKRNVSINGNSGNNNTRTPPIRPTIEVKIIERALGDSPRRTLSSSSAVNATLTVREPFSGSTSGGGGSIKRVEDSSGSNGNSNVVIKEKERSSRGSVDGGSGDKGVSRGVQQQRSPERRPPRERSMDRDESSGKPSQSQTQRRSNEDLRDRRKSSRDLHGEEKRLSDDLRSNRRKSNWNERSESSNSSKKNGALNKDLSRSPSRSRSPPPARSRSRSPPSVNKHKVLSSQRRSADRSRSPPSPVALRDRGSVNIRSRSRSTSRDKRTSSSATVAATVAVVASPREKRRKIGERDYGTQKQRGSSD